jgi:hypothetical protein
MTSYEVLVATGNSTQTFFGCDCATISNDIAPYTAKLDATTAAGSSITAKPNDADIIVHDGSGGYYIYGDNLSLINDTASQKIVHVNSDGTWDSTFAPTNPNSSVSILYVSGNYLYVGGSFTTIAGQAMPRLVRFNITTGAIDTGWAPNPANGTVSAVHVVGSYVYVGGSFTGVNSIGGTTGLTRNRLARVAVSDGSLDIADTWNPNPSTGGSSVYAITNIGSDIYVGGDFTTIGSTPATRNRLAKLDNTTGAADGSWNPNANGLVRQIIADGSDLYVNGSFTSIGGVTPKNYLAKLDDSTGATDLDWNPNPANSNLSRIAIVSDGVIIGSASSTATFGGQTTITNLGKVNKTDGGIDATWDPVISGYTGWVDTDGDYVYVSVTAGGFSRSGGVRRAGAAAINNTTGNYTSWAPTIAGGYINDYMVATDDLVYISGTFSTVNGVAKAGFAAVDTDTGAIDPTFNIGAVVGSHPDPRFVYGDYLYLSGSFTSIGGTAVGGFARVNKTTGAIDTAWNPGAWSTYMARAGSYIYYEDSGSLKRISIATGTVDGGYSKATDGSIDFIVSDGTSVFPVGYYGTIGGVARTNVAKFNGDTGDLDTDWNPVLDDGAYFGNLVGDTLYMIGSFTTINGDPLTNDYIGAINVDTGEASNWNPRIRDYNIDGVGAGPDALIINGIWLDRVSGFVHFMRFQQPELNLTSSTGSGSEDVATMNIPLTFSFAPDIAIDVSYEATGGTATEGQDYSLGSGTTTIAAGSTTAEIPITLEDDNDFEGHETIQITLTSASDALLGETVVYTYTINEDDSLSTTGSSSGGGGSIINQPSVPPVIDTPLTPGIPTPGSPTTPALPQPMSPTFTRDLQYGSNGSDVTLLQQFLNRQGYTLAPSGYGSPGNETIYFRGRTMRALKRFQQAYIDRIQTVTGRLEGVTKDLINFLY